MTRYSTVLFGLALAGASSATTTAAPRHGIARAEPSTSAASRQQIEDLMVRYMDMLDAGDYDGYAALFAPDALLIYAEHRLRGPRQIHDVVRGELEGLRRPKTADGRPGPPLGMHHLLLNPIVVVTGRTATATATWMFVKVTPDGRSELWGAGRYIDSFALIDGRWRFTSRRVTDTVAETVAAAKAFVPR